MFIRYICRLLFYLLYVKMTGFYELVFDVFWKCIKFFVAVNNCLICTYIMYIE